MNPNEIYLGVGMFITIVLALVFIIMFAKSKLVPEGEITIRINGGAEDPIEMQHARHTKYEVCAIHDEICSCRARKNAIPRDWK